MTGGHETPSIPAESPFNAAYIYIYVPGGEVEDAAGLAAVLHVLPNLPLVVAELPCEVCEVGMVWEICTHISTGLYVPL